MEHSLLKKEVTLVTGLPGGVHSSAEAWEAREEETRKEVSILNFNLMGQLVHLDGLGLRICGLTWGHHPRLTGRRA